MITVEQILRALDLELRQLSEAEYMAGCLRFLAAIFDEPVEIDEIHGA